jgi:hypothetical protein
MQLEVLSQRYERSSTQVTGNLPFTEWNEVQGSERLTGLVAVEQSRICGLPSITTLSNFSGYGARTKLPQ